MKHGSRPLPNHVPHRQLDITRLRRSAGWLRLGFGGIFGGCRGQGRFSHSGYFYRTSARGSETGFLRAYSLHTPKTAKNPVSLVLMRPRVCHDANKYVTFCIGFLSFSIATTCLTATILTDECAIGLIINSILFINSIFYFHPQIYEDKLNF
jgi:hypothetical protein